MDDYITPSHQNDTLEAHLYFDESECWHALSAEQAQAYVSLMLPYSHERPVTQKSTLAWIVFRLCQSEEGVGALLRHLHDPYLKSTGVVQGLNTQAFDVWRDMYENKKTPPARRPHRELLENLMVQAVPFTPVYALVHTFLHSLPSADFSTAVLDRILHHKDLAGTWGQEEDRLVEAFLTHFMASYHPQNTHHSTWLEVAHNSTAMFKATWNALIKSDVAWAHRVLPCLSDGDFKVFLEHLPSKVVNNPQVAQNTLSRVWGNMTSDQQHIHLMHPIFDGCQETLAYRERQALQHHVFNSTSLDSETGSPKKKL